MGRFGKALLLAAVALPFAATSAYAQNDEVSAGETEAAASEKRLGSVVVKARKRDENLQEVPVVVQAFDADALRDYTTSDFSDLSDLVSGLSIVADGPVSPSINLRGIQTSAASSVSDNAVSVVVDGVSYSSAQIFNFGLFDLEAVEVLKGPQALYFGKNSPGGVVAVRTQNPTDEFYTELQAGYEFEGERVYGHGIVSGPISENWGGRLGVRVAAQDGYFNNIWGQGDPTEDQPFDLTGPDYDEYMLIGTLQGEFNRGSLTLKAIHANREGGLYTQGQIIQCNTLNRNEFSDCTLDKNFSTAPFVPNQGVAPSVVTSGDEPFYEYELTQLTADGELELNENWSLNSVTGYVEIENAFLGNVGPRSLSISSGLGFGSRPSVRTISEELRLTGEFDRFNVTLGAFVDDRDISSFSKLWLTPTFALTPDLEFSVDARSWSLFAQADYDVTDTLSVSLGGRYTDEERETAGRNLQAGVRGSVIGAHKLDPSEVSYTDFSPEVTVSWQPADNVNLFASYKEAFKSGGFAPSSTRRYLTAADGATPIDDSFDREEVEGFEIGAKTELFDSTLRLNVAAFSYEYTDLQQSAFEGPEIRTVNAGKALVDGVEVDALWLTPVEGLTLSGNLAYNSNEFDDFIAECNEHQLFVSAGDCNVNVDGDLSTWADGSNPNVRPEIIALGADGQQRAGDPLRRAPKWAGSFGFNYETPLSNTLNLRANGLATFSDEYQANGEDNPWGVQESYWVLNAGIGIEADDESWALNLIGRNLTDEAYMTSAFDHSRSGSSSVPEAMVALRNAPRQIFVELTIRPHLFGK